MIGRIEATLAGRGVADNTYLVFSSDNGYHMGEHRLLQGKMTAFDTDIRVPLIVVGPGVPAGTHGAASSTENIDLRPTFSQLAGARCPRPSTATASCRCSTEPTADTLAGRRADRAPRARRAPVRPGHPGAARAATRRPTRRSAPQNAVYVEYTNGEREYYDLSQCLRESSTLTDSQQSTARSAPHRIRGPAELPHRARAALPRTRSFAADALTPADPDLGARLRSSHLLRCGQHEHPVGIAVGVLPGRLPADLARAREGARHRSGTSRSWVVPSSLHAFGKARHVDDDGASGRQVGDQRAFRPVSTRW